MRTSSPPYCRLDLVPSLADRFIVGVAPLDYGPVFLLMPFGFHLAVDTLSSGCLSTSCELRYILCSFHCFQLCIRLGFPLFDTPGQRGIIPAFGYGTPYPSARGTLTLLSNALSSAQYVFGRLHPTHINNHHTRYRSFLFIWSERENSLLPTIDAMLPPGTNSSTHCSMSPEPSWGF